jgi:Zn-dependent M28 family amino/carboxypeptidase
VPPRPSSSTRATQDGPGLFNGSLSGNEQIPVIFTSYAVGTQLLGQYVPGSDPVLTIDVKTIDDPNRSDWNVIADSKGGDPNNILVIDAHLDAIFGAGMLDNASGSATILDIAQQLKNTNTRNKLRFIWFGGEELGLLGSDYYVNTLPADELAKIKFDLDADVTATPNYVAGVLDPKDGVTLFGRNPGTPMPPSIWAPSAIARDYGIDYLNSIGKNNILFSADGTDAFMFQQAGSRRAVSSPARTAASSRRTSRSSAATRATSRALCRGTTGAAWTTRSAGATTSATTTPRC